MKFLSIKKETRAINFVDKKSVENINSFHELANCKEIRNFAEKKGIRCS